MFGLFKKKSKRPVQPPPPPAPPPPPPEDEAFRLLSAVVDEDTFIAFVRSLEIDFRQSREIEEQSPSSPYGPVALGWENTRIDAMLDAAARWAEDSRKPGNEWLVSANPWRRVADILYAGKIYE